jgi:hypothetical protein
MMAGLMQRVVRNFRPGDFIRVGEYFGRVSEQGLFHVEIQTEDRDLTTMPNLYLVTHPVKVIRSSGTLVTAEVSLGYDVDRQEIKKALLEAVLSVGLAEPFVHVVELGDFSVTYRAAGLLTEVNSLITMRSKLRASMFDFLHRAGLEIVSPTFMNQRVYDPGRRFMPPAVAGGATDDEPALKPEDIVFDKAEEAASIERLQERREALKKDMSHLKKRIDEAGEESLRADLSIELETLDARLKRLDAYIAARQQSEE